MQKYCIGFLHFGIYRLILSYFMDIKIDGSNYLICYCDFMSVTYLTKVSFECTFAIRTVT
jgi:hypothetical protein